MQAHHDPGGRRVLQRLANRAALFIAYAAVYKETLHHNCWQRPAGRLPGGGKFASPASIGAAATGVAWRPKQSGRRVAEGSAALAGPVYNQGMTNLLRSDTMNPLVSIAVGAGLMYLLDPKEGKQRRAELYKKVEDADFLKTMEQGLKDFQSTLDTAAQKWWSKSAGSGAGAGASGATGAAGHADTAEGAHTGTTAGASSVSEETLTGKDERAG